MCENHMDLEPYQMWDHIRSCKSLNPTKAVDGYKLAGAHITQAVYMKALEKNRYKEMKKNQHRIEC